MFQKLFVLDILPHFCPSSTGHPACRVRGSVSPERSMLYQNAADPCEIPQKAITMILCLDTACVLFSDRHTCTQGVHPKRLTYVQPCTILFLYFQEAFSLLRIICWKMNRPTNLHRGNSYADIRKYCGPASLCITQLVRNRTGFNTNNLKK